MQGARGDQAVGSEKILLLLSSASTEMEEQGKKSITFQYGPRTNEHEHTTARQSPQIMMFYRKKWFLKELLMLNVLNLFSPSSIPQLHFSFFKE